MLFSVKNVGQIAEAKVKFGDLTVLVGAQGSGKSIFLQLFKLCKDQEYIKNTMADFGQDWNQNDNADLISVYMGKGDVIGKLNKKIPCTAARINEIPFLIVFIRGNAFYELKNYISRSVVNAGRLALSQALA